MILWNRNRTCELKRLDSYGREITARCVATHDTLKLARWLNIVFNVLALGITIAIFGFNLAAFAISFVLTDFILTILDNLIFIIIPRWRTMSSSIEASQKRIEAIKEKHDALYDYGFCSKQGKDDATIMARFINEEQAWVDAHIEKIKEEKIKSDDKTSKDYSDKEEYFKVLFEKLTYFAKTYDIACLLPMIEQIKCLRDTLAKKPIGYTLIPGTLYAYLDELQNIVQKWIDLDNVQKEKYTKDISKISSALSENIKNLHERINRLETEDIEVGIAVLLKELTEESKKVEGSNV